MFGVAIAGGEKALIFAPALGKIRGRIWGEQRRAKKVKKKFAGSLEGIKN